MYSEPTASSHVFGHNAFANNCDTVILLFGLCTV